MCGRSVLGKDGSAVVEPPTLRDSAARTASAGPAAARPRLRPFHCWPAVLFDAPKLGGLTLHSIWKMARTSYGLGTYPGSAQTLQLSPPRAREREPRSERPTVRICCVLSYSLPPPEGDHTRQFARGVFRGVPTCPALEDVPYVSSGHRTPMRRHHHLGGRNPGEDSHRSI